MRNPCRWPFVARHLSPRLSPLPLCVSPGASTFHSATLFYFFSILSLSLSLSFSSCLTFLLAFPPFCLTPSTVLADIVLLLRPPDSILRVFRTWRSKGEQVLERTHARLSHVQKYFRFSRVSRARDEIELTFLYFR